VKGGCGPRRNPKPNVDDRSKWTFSNVGDGEEGGWEWAGLLKSPGEKYHKRERKNSQKAQPGQEGPRKGALRSRLEERRKPGRVPLMGVPNHYKNDRRVELSRGEEPTMLLKRARLKEKSLQMGQARVRRIAVA